MSGSSSTTSTRRVAARRRATDPRGCWPTMRHHPTRGRPDGGQPPGVDAGAASTVRSVATRVLVIDNYDSFVYNLVQYLGELGADPVVHRNDELTIDELVDLE